MPPSQVPGRAVYRYTSFYYACELNGRKRMRLIRTGQDDAYETKILRVGLPPEWWMSATVSTVSSIGS
jgi:hypothetical protein